MASMNDAPCRISAELRAKQLREDQYVPVEFDHHNEDHFRAILPAELVKPVMGLVRTYMQLDAAERTFGADYKRAIEWLYPDLNGLREACARMFAEL